MRRAFEDGTILSVPNSVRIGQLELKAGAQVKAAYEEQDGKKVVTTLKVFPSSRGR